MIILRILSWMKKKKNHWRLFLMVYFASSLILAQWLRTGDKLLSEPTMTQLTDAYMYSVYFNNFWEYTSHIYIYIYIEISIWSTEQGLTGKSFVLHKLTHAYSYNFLCDHRLRNHHYSLIRLAPYSDKELGQHWLRYWLVAWGTKPLPEPMLTSH